MLGMFITGFIDYFLGLFEVEKIVSLPELPAIIDFDLSGVFSRSLFFVIVSVLLIIIIDAAGTLRLLDEDNNITRNEGTYKVNVAYVSDSVATLVGALFGSTPAAPYIESKKGKRLGARSGLAALTVAVLLLLSVFFLPLVEAVSSVAAFTAPVLFIVGRFFVQRRISHQLARFQRSISGFSRDVDHSVDIEHRDGDGDRLCRLNVHPTRPG